MSSDPSDEIYAEFIQLLDDADHINLTDWETQFIESNFTRTTFSEKQREVLEKMRKKYESRI